jgi:hypothetical protein
MAVFYPAEIKGVRADRREIYSESCDLKDLALNRLCARIVLAKKPELLMLVGVLELRQKPGKRVN